MATHILNYPFCWAKNDLSFSLFHCGKIWANLYNTIQAKISNFLCLKGLKLLSFIQIHAILQRSYRLLRKISSYLENCIAAPGASPCTSHAKNSYIIFGWCSIVDVLIKLQAVIAITFQWNFHKRPNREWKMCFVINLFYLVIFSKYFDDNFARRGIKYSGGYYLYLIFLGKCVADTFSNEEKSEYIVRTLSYL